jgi:hypothetical protein
MGMDVRAGKVLCLELGSAKRSPFRGMYVMASDDKLQQGRARERARAKMKAPNQHPFDMWLQKQLHAMYDEIASEPLPDDLLSLINSDAAKKGKPSDSGKK